MAIASAVTFGHSNIGEREWGEEFSTRYREPYRYSVVETFPCTGRSLSFVTRRTEKRG
jgi:hypothetical protein